MSSNREEYYDYLISFTIDNKENRIYLPCNDNYKVIADAVLKVCSLFDKELVNKNIDRMLEEKKKVEDIADLTDVNILIVCEESELYKMVKYHNSFFIEPTKIELSNLVTVTNATSFSEMADTVYSKLMSEISHNKFK